MRPHIIAIGVSLVAVLACGGGTEAPAPTPTTTSVTVASPLPGVGEYRCFGMEQHDPVLGDIQVAYEVTRDADGVLQLTSTQRGSTFELEMAAAGLVMGDEAGEQTLIGSVGGQDVYLTVQLDNNSLWLQAMGQPQRDHIPEVACG